MLAPWFTRKEKETIAMDLLLVDDSKTMRLLVHRAIRQAGYRGLTVCEAENGADALEKLKTLKPRLILSDWNMPEMSGIDFLRKLRAENNVKRPSGLLLPRRPQSSRISQWSSGASFIIIKPFGVDEVQAALEPILGEA
jgi:two-component system chemotaxis response regulator CheY